MLGFGVSDFSNSTTVAGYLLLVGHDGIGLEFGDFLCLKIAKLL